MDERRIAKWKWIKKKIRTHLKSYINCVPRYNGVFGDALYIFFTATDKELAYYVKDDALPPIEKDYIFFNLIK